MGKIVRTRRDFLRVMGLGAASLVIPGGQTAAQQLARTDKRPNIIFVLADDLGYGDLGCYGQKTIQTPNLDHMAAEGMRFTQHYAGSTVCAPSRCVLMTGLHTGHCYVRGNRRVEPMGQVPLPPGTITVGKILKEAGYSTGLIGKWGLGGPGSTGVPVKQGFDFFYGYMCQRHAHNYYPEFLFRNEERIPLKGNKVANPRPDGTGWSIERTQYSHDLFAQESLAFVERNKDRPFFLYLALTIPHANNEAGKRGMEVPSYEPYANEDWPEPQKGYAAMISRMDRDVGRLLAKLKQLGLDEDTLVMFSSDNGPHREGGADPTFFRSSGLLRGIKRDLYEGGIRVPLIARWPAKIKPGSQNEHISAFWDFLPTCCELAGVEAPSKVDGISLLPTLLGESEKQKTHKFMYWEFHERGFTQAMRMGDWKAVRFHAPRRLELFNLKDDIGEKHNLADQHPEVISLIEEYLKTARSASELWPVS
jgi:arylsulfatase A